MRTHLRLLLGAFAAAGLGAGTLTACGLVPGETFEDETGISEKVTSVRLDDPTGGVELRSRQTVTDVTVHRRIEVDGDKPKATHRVEDGVLVLRGCGPDCEVNYTVDLPPRVSVSGRSSSGGVTLSGVGAVDVRTSSGAVALDDVDGPVDVRTENGRINGRGLKGERVRAQTSNGAIDLSLATPQDVRARASNGAISLTVPDGRYRVSAETSNGSRRIGVRDDPSGDHTLDLSTGNGRITVKSP